MLPSTLDWLTDELEKIERLDLRRVRAVRESPQTAEVVLDNRRLVNFGANDYLGLAADPRLSGAVRRSLNQTGWGSGASPLVSGRSHWHRELEQKIAELEHVEAALLFASGFAACSGTIPALVGEGDAIYADATNHASLIDGCRLSRAERFVYPHNDWQTLEAMLADSNQYRRRLIVTDALFSMDGDFAPLVELGRLAEQYHAMLMVDEAHATGVWGAAGRGVVEQLAAHHPELEQQVTVRLGTLSKALGSSGGFVAGCEELVEWLANRARSYVFSTAGVAATAAAAVAAIDIIRDEPHRRKELIERSRWLREALTARGWNIAGSQSQIVPVVVGDAGQTMQLAAKLREAGLYVPGIRPPTVPEGTSRLRISLSWLHSDEAIERLVDCLGKR